MSKGQKSLPGERTAAAILIGQQIQHALGADLRNAAISGVAAFGGMDKFWSVLAGIYYDPKARHKDRIDAGKPLLNVLQAIFQHDQKALGKAFANLTEDQLRDQLDLALKDVAKTMIEVQGKAIGKNGNGQQTLLYDGGDHAATSEE